MLSTTLASSLFSRDSTHVEGGKGDGKEEDERTVVWNWREETSSSASSTPSGQSLFLRALLIATRTGNVIKTKRERGEKSLGLKGRHRLVRLTQTKKKNMSLT